MTARHARAGTLLLVLAAFLAALLGARAQDVPVDTGPTLPPALEARARAIGLEVRCPVCRGLPIAESPADLARQMMGELRRQLQAGATDDQVRQFFVTKYGEGVLLSPPKTGLNLLVWLGPIAAVLIGAAILVSYLRGATRRPAPVEADPRLIERVRRDLAERAPSEE